MNETTPPPKIIQDLAVGYWASRCLHVVAELGVADALGDEGQTAEALGAYHKAEIEKWWPIIKSANINLEPGR